MSFLWDRKTWEESHSLIKRLSTVKLLLVQLTTVTGKFHPSAQKVESWLFTFEPYRSHFVFKLIIWFIWVEVLWQYLCIFVYVNWSSYLAKKFDFPYVNSKVFFPVGA